MRAVSVTEDSPEEWSKSDADPMAISAGLAPATAMRMS